jgi:hypothetical protein
MTTHATRSPFDSRASSHGVVPRTLTATLLLAAIASADVRAQPAPWMIGPFTKPWR